LSVKLITEYTNPIIDKICNECLRIYHKRKQYDENNTELLYEKILDTECNTTIAFSFADIDEDIMNTDESNRYFTNHIHNKIMEFIDTEEQLDCLCQRFQMMDTNDEFNYDYHYTIERITIDEQMN
jgi:hypothetical protein